MKRDIEAIRKNIKMLVMDVDGTLTDGKIYISKDGECFKAFDIKDGYGIAVILPKCGITPTIITGRSSEIVEQRCKELKIKHFYQGCTQKKQKLDELLVTIGGEIGETLTYENVAYIGDDIFDIPCMELAGICACPADAVDEVLSICDFVCKKNAGAGAVREFIDFLVK